MNLSITPQVGDALPEWRVDSVDADKIRMMALILEDPNPIHYDLDAVREAQLGDRYVNQGGVTMAYIINMLTSWSGSRAAIRSLDCRFNANVFAGDSLVAGGTITGLTTAGDEVLAECDVWVRKASDDTKAPPVVGGKATVAIG